METKIELHRGPSNCSDGEGTPQQFQVLSSTVPVTQHGLKSSSSVVLGIAWPWNAAAVGHQTMQSLGEGSGDRHCSPFNIMQTIRQSTCSSVRQRDLCRVTWSSTERCRARLRHNCAAEAVGLELEAHTPVFRDSLFWPLRHVLTRPTSTLFTSSIRYAQQAANMSFRLFLFRAV